MTTYVSLQTNSSGWLTNADGTIGAVVALNAATGAGISSVIDLGTTSQAIILETIVTGAPTAVEVTVESTNDINSTWRTVIMSQSTTGDHWKAGAGLRYLRARLVNIAGGTSPTATATIAAI